MGVCFIFTFIHLFIKSVLRTISSEVLPHPKCLAVTR